MVKKRMILCLLMRNDGIFVNSRNFTLQPVGELEWIKSYLDFNSIDELVLLNVDRGPKDVEDFSRHMQELACTCFVPIAAGGGVKSVRDFEILLDAGCDKVVVNSHAIVHPEFVTEAARRFGSQCVVASVDVKSDRDGGWHVWGANGSENTRMGVVDWARQLEDLGAGEIFLTSIDQDGVGKGYDLDLVRTVVDSVGVPVIASGGVGDFKHLVDGIIDGRAEAVSAANIFHYIGNGLLKAKKHIANQGLAFPMWNFM
jgi:imidazole glycerol-phosphate synthase subunit HisF